MKGTAGEAITFEYQILEVSIRACDKFYENPKNRVFIHLGQGDYGAIKLVRMMMWL